jgi:predicted nucleotidyltransferase
LTRQWRRPIIIGVKHTVPRTLSPLNAAAIESLKAAAISYYGVRLVSLAIFGSIARGTATPESDIDVLIVAKDLPRGRIPRVRDFDAVEEKTLRGLGNPKGLEISPIFKTIEEVRAGGPLFWDMTEEVIILHDRDSFLESFLETVSARLRALGARRVFKGSAWYWILKEEFTPGEVFELP